MLDPTAWPWIALGRVNRESGGFCTGALVAPELVVTAAHCLQNARTGRPLTPDSLHFLVGYRRGDFLGHARVKRVIRPDGPALNAGQGFAVVAADWAILVLSAALPVRPLPVRALSAGEQPGIGDDGRLMRAGYGRDRPHLLSLHDGCAVVDRAAGGAVLVHTCDAVQGDSGSPLLIFDGQAYAVFAINSGVARVGGRSRGIAVHAAAFLPTLRSVVAGTTGGVDAARRDAAHQNDSGGQR